MAGGGIGMGEVDHHLRLHGQRVEAVEQPDVRIGVRGSGARPDGTADQRGTLPAHLIDQQTAHAAANADDAYMQKEKPPGWMRRRGLISRAACIRP